MLPLPCPLLQVQEEVQRWLAGHDQAGAAALASSVPAGPAGRHCLAGSSLSNSRGSSPSWSGSDTAPAAGAVLAGPSSAPSTSSSSGGSSEDGSSTAWRLCAHMQRGGWPARHCASVRSGGGRNGAGWRANSGHEFLLLFPRPGGGQPAASSGASSGGSSGGDSEMGEGAAALVVDPEFREQFLLPSPSPRYQVRAQPWAGWPAARRLRGTRAAELCCALHTCPAPRACPRAPAAQLCPPLCPWVPPQVVLSLLPRAFVGSYDRLQRLVCWACEEMQASLRASGGSLPPWRSLAHVLNKWRLCSEEEEEEEEGAGAGPAAPGQPAAPPAGPGAAAFSAAQQAAMQSLLQQPTAAAHQALFQPQPLTASSSCSSMDVAPPSPAAHGPPGPGPTRPRSLLTHKLSELAAAMQHD